MIEKQVCLLFEFTDALLSRKIQPKLLKAVRLCNSIITQNNNTNHHKNSTLRQIYPLEWNGRSENYLILQWRTLRHRRYTGLNDLLKVAYKSVAFNPNSTSKSPTEASKYAAIWEPLQTC